MLYSLDRFEDDWAVLVDETGESRDVRRALLPPDAAPGDMFRERAGVFVADADAAAARRAEIQRLQEKLLKNSR
mgnify:CR=1 FL=1